MDRSHHVLFAGIVILTHPYSEVGNSNLTGYKLSNKRYKRSISEKLSLLATQFPAIVLTGARQTGKTPLLRSLFPHHQYVSLDLPADAALAEDDPTNFLRRFPPPLIIDEVQYAPKLFRHLKIAIDRDRDKNGLFILTGSQKFTLMKEVSDSLAGRAAVLGVGHVIFLVPTKGSSIRYNLS